MWAPGCRRNLDGYKIAEWAAKTGLTYIGEPGIPTHQAGGVLDIAFSNIPFASAKVAASLHPGADHEGIQITVPHGGMATPEQRRPALPEAGLDKFCELVAMGITSIPLPTKSNSAEELDVSAAKILAILSEALQALGREKIQGRKSAPWWTDECAAAHKGFLRAKRQNPHLEGHSLERRGFLRAVRQAKRAYWRNQIDSIKSDNDLYRIVRWHKLGPATRAPPLVVDGVAIENTTDKAHALKKALLERFTSDDDIDYNPLDAHLAPSNYLPWQEHISYEEIEDATISTKSTAPGVDGISIRLLKACWNSIKEHVLCLFQACLLQGHHPRPFRTAQIVMLQKPNKSDYTQTRSWRPISLLSCLGKGLERLVARRIAHTALVQKVLSPQQIGALPKRSTIDLVSCLTHDIEHALEGRNSVATVMTLDIQGAYDSVLRKRLLLRLRDQGWPLKIIQFIGSFTDERQAYVRLENSTTDIFRTDCGLPQGSPISPILFLLYIADVFLQDTKHRFGYADDISVYRIGRTLEENATKLSKDLERILKWGEENKVSFDPDKCELMHFTRRNALPENLPEVQAPGYSLVIRQTTEKAMRWLGIWLDRKLHFKDHIAKRVALANKLTRHIHNLARTTRGPPASALRKAILTCVIPTVTFGAEIWYGGATKSPTGKKHKNHTEVATRQQTSINDIDIVIRNAIRAALPVYRTTPRATLHRDAGIPTAAVILDNIRQRYGLRLRTIDQEHPAIPRLPQQRGRADWELQPVRTKLQSAARLLPELPRLQLQTKRHVPNSQVPIAQHSKADTATSFREWQRSLPAGHLVVFSDGSKTSSGNVGWGYAIYAKRKKVAQGKGRLGIAEVFDGEAEGARHGLRHALRIRPNGNIHVCLDNTAVVQGLRGEMPKSSQAAFQEFHDACMIADVHTHWVPGHEGIEGNEEADRLAKEGTTLDTPPNCQPTYAGALGLVRARTRDQFSAWWVSEITTHERYQTLGLTAASLRCPRELELPHRILHRLLACRTGHGDFDWYHKMYNHDNTRNCTCGGIKTTEHLVYCRKARKFRALWPKFKPEPQTLKEYWQHLMASPKDFAAFLEITSFYEKICPR
ncbi:hypothetical protein ACJ41O_013888 [Fusarium nematophilum]